MMVEVRNDEEREVILSALDALIVDLRKRQRANWDNRVLGEDKNICRERNIAEDLLVRVRLS